MKSACLIVIATGLAAAATPVLAGGPVVPVPEPVVAAPVMAPPAPSFAGAYIGGGIGYAFGGDDDVGILTNDASNGLGNRRAGTLELGGPIGNVHGGYRWQQPGSRMVYGVEGMATLGGVDADEESRGYKSSSVVKWTASIKGSVGFTVRPDTLVYGFAGYSVGQSEYDITGAGGTVNETRNLDGYVVGLGVEKMLNERWSVRGEYQYSNYGRDRMDAENDAYHTYDTPEFNALRVGVNYRF
ncbi:outer membrane protein [Falsirhodobacter algicola]|uniref:Outer membrane beta-barrel protein n=1 Tax=Falsirhodobacter algicola TaxID=2692330 RepID=A0A8J8MRH1_9RHOB|nr:outer membrane beta-barrel protein [Falsirhodobacter algicola]QUS35385.1 outer membrane beta-barrel protein [Falsirhodobacter algicola]